MHPILFTIPTPWGQLPIWSYGVMLGLSMIVAWYTIMYLGQKKEGLSQELMGNTFMATAVSALLGARLLYILTNLEEFGDPMHWFSFSSGGLVAYGGFLGGLAGAWGYLRLKKVPLLAWADVVAPTLASGLMLTRVETPRGPVTFMGDLIPGTPWVHLPITMGYDRYPELLIDEKHAMLDRVIDEGGWAFFTHDPKVAASKIGRNEKGKYVPLEPLETLAW